MRKLPHERKPMPCSQNNFCSSLPDKTRTALCQSCRKCMFKAGSIQTRGDFSQNCMLILDGASCSVEGLDSASFGHSDDEPVLFLALPGRAINLDVTFGFTEMQDAYEYSNFIYLTDTWVASFNHQAIRDLFDADKDFQMALIRNMVRVQSDACRFTALFRANFTFHGVFHLMKLLTEHSIYLTQQDMGRLMNRDRTSISKAVNRLRDENPSLWEAYLKNKGRAPAHP